MSDKVFDVLKYIQRIALPAISTFLAAVLSIFDVSGDTIAIITGVIAAVITLMGALLQFSTYQYQKEKEAIE